ncbi:hypothetical protein CHY_0643 [Carboxydothermus hydrogenoformans Z-2901]|uniref:Uncharacterized protein n=1 Tax=Carboxydothermus hydrogenoformans (strain ATCC BAA-161 / DSM 6008 / Z-2901) TaxID=246194 RepID=Q3AED5_CARHZ|nr:hypothetical protein CHY_0643 [Carboxydothermus hydrogenoformans Z-2901]
MERGQWHPVQAAAAKAVPVVLGVNVDFKRVGFCRLFFCLLKNSYQIEVIS